MATVDNCFELIVLIHQLIVHAELDRIGAIKHSAYIKLIEQEKNLSDDLYKSFVEKGD